MLVDIGTVRGCDFLGLLCVFGAGVYLTKGGSGGGAGGSCSGLALPYSLKRDRRKTARLRVVGTGPSPTVRVIFSRSCRG